MSNNKSDEANARSEATALTQYQVCLAGNESRAENLALWVKVVALVDGHTAAGKKFDTEVLALARAADMPRTCTPPSKP